MRVIAPAVLAFFGFACCTQAASDLAQQARQLELAGNGSGARALLQKAAQDPNADAATLLAYAQYLDKHRDPGTKEAYAKALAAAKSASDQPAQALAAKRLLVLDLLSNDRAAAERDLQAYHDAGRNDLTLPAPKAEQAQGAVSIPGPLRSFARMAALSPDLGPEETLGALARNVVTSGYQAGNSNEGLEPTEYLKLVVRYLSQARELEKLAGKDQTIVVETCESTQTADLLRVLGFRMRGGCGSEVVLETVNATRAFLTADSGFPLAELEQSLRTNRPFRYDYHPTKVPVLYGADYWLSTSREKTGADFIDYFVSDPALCRLYLGLSKLDRQTADALKKSVSAQKIRAFAHVLDFYGGMFEIRDGKALVPGGAKSQKAWAELVGANPDQGATFFEKLLAKDDGWLASYYDALARVNGALQDYLTEPTRIKRFYAAIRGKLTSPGPARPVFRANTDMLLLTANLRLDPDGRPHIPGNLEVWKDLFVHHPQGKYDGKLTKAAASWKEPDELIEALFALCRKAVENEPLKIYMTVSDIDRQRARPLQPATVDRLIRSYHELGPQYAVFSETPTLRDQTIVQMLDTAVQVNSIRDMALRADTAGLLQGTIGLWQVLCRHNEINPAQADETLSAILKEFGKTKSDRELFDSGRTAIRTLLTATNSPEVANPQERVLDLLAGSRATTDDESHRQVISDMTRTFDAQRLISLKTIFDLADHLDSLAKGGKLNSTLINKTTARIMEVQLPRASLSSTEKNSMAYGYWTDKHIEAQRKLNIKAAVEKAGNDPEKLRDVRGMLAPILRDTVVGLNYAYYAPPGAQVLQTNPLFVRSHDFIGSQSNSQVWRATEVFGTGWPSSAGGRLAGSLIGLPYTLAEAEQNFLVPAREQALIWGDLVPQMLISAKVPRYGNVTAAQLHYVALHMHYGESLLAGAALDPARRKEVVGAFTKLASPARTLQLDQYLAEGQVSRALEHVMPSELYDLAATLQNSPHGDGEAALTAEMKQLAAEQPERVSSQAISRAFGTPKPTLRHSYAPELLHLRTFPTLMGYSSRIMAETWESNILYYAALADELHLSPAQLNVYVPQWTQITVEKIFATHLEDWPALLRSLRMTGDEVRAKARASAAGFPQKAALN